MKLPEFKNKPFNTLTNAEKIALIERVCMDLLEYLNLIGNQGREASFVKHWCNYIINHPAPSNSSLLDNYIYIEGSWLNVTDKRGATISLKYAVTEILAFIHNSISQVPVMTDLISRIEAGESAQSICDSGIESAKALEPIKVKAPRKVTGRPKNPNSLAARIKRGEITRYEAYQKKTASEDDAL